MARLESFSQVRHSLPCGNGGRIIMQRSLQLLCSRGGRVGCGHHHYRLLCHHRLTPRRSFYFYSATATHHVPELARNPSTNSITNHWSSELQPQSYESLVQKGYDILEQANALDHKNSSEWRRAAERVVWQLFRATPKAIDTGEQQQEQQQQQQKQSLEDLNAVITVESMDLGFVLMDILVNEFQFHDTQLLNTMLLTWYAVTKAALANRCNHEDLILPEKLLPLLDGWTKELRSSTTTTNNIYHNNHAKSQQQEHHQQQKNTIHSLVTWKSLSYMIAICQQRSKQIDDLTQRRELAEFTEGLLRRMATNSNSSVPPSTPNLNATLAIWTSLPDSTRARQLLDTAVEQWGVIPDTRSYNAVLISLTKSPEEAENLLYEWKDRIDIHSWNIVLNAWAQHNNVRRVEQLLYSMTMRPNLYTYNTALTVWAKAGKVDLCEQVISEMHKAYENPNNRTLEQPPDLITYGILMHSFAKAGKSDEAEELANELYTQYIQYGRDDLKPTLMIYTPILHAYSQKIRNIMSPTGDRPPDLGAALAAVARAHMVLERMHGLYHVGALDQRPDSAVFLALLQCYQHVHLAKASMAERGEDILFEMIDRMPKDSQLFNAYSIVIQMWLRLGKDGTTRAKELLDQAWKNDDIRSKMDGQSLHCIFVGFTRADCPEMAQSILLRWCDAVTARQMTATPKVATFGAMIGAWKRSSSKAAPQQADLVVKDLERLQKQNLIVESVDRLFYEGILKCWAFADVDGNEHRAHYYLTKMRTWAHEGNAQMAPPKELYHLVMMACCQGKANPVLAERVLVEMIDDCALGARQLAPCARAYNSAITAWKKSGHPAASKRAYLLFEEMAKRHVAPDVITYKCVLACLANGRRQVDAGRADEILQRIESDTSTRYNDCDIISFYGNVITAWCRVTNSVRATSVLMAMCNGILHGNVKSKPPPWYFDIAIKCLKNDSRKKKNDSQIAKIKELKFRILGDQQEVSSKVLSPKNHNIASQGLV